MFREAGLCELDQALRGCRQNLAESLLGPHNRSLSTRSNWRFGRGDKAAERFFDVKIGPQPVVALAADVAPKR
jgi:hypothetical protein